MYVYIYIYTLYVNVSQCQNIYIENKTFIILPNLRR